MAMLFSVLFDEVAKIAFFLDIKRVILNLVLFRMTRDELCLDKRVYSSTNSKSSLVTPQSGQAQSSGISSNKVPGAIPLSGSPTAGS